jgi:hypothetical protein
MTYNIPQHISGDTWKGIGSISFKKNGVPLNISGYDIEASFKLSIASPKVLTLTVQNSGISILSGPEGRISIPSRIVDIPVGKYSWYLTLTSPEGNKKTYLMGLWTIVPNIPLVTEYERRNYN